MVPSANNRFFRVVGACRESRRMVMGHLPLVLLVDELVSLEIIVEDENNPSILHEEFLLD